MLPFLSDIFPLDDDLCPPRLRSVGSLFPENAPTFYFLLLFLYSLGDYLEPKTCEFKKLSFLLPQLLTWTYQS